MKSNWEVRYTNAVKDLNASRAREERLKTELATVRTTTRRLEHLVSKLANKSLPGMADEDRWIL